MCLSLSQGYSYPFRIPGRMIYLFGPSKESSAFSDPLIKRVFLHPARESGNGFPPRVFLTLTFWITGLCTTSELEAKWKGGSVSRLRLNGKDWGSFFLSSRIFVNEVWSVYIRFDCTYRSLTSSRKKTLEVDQNFNIGHLNLTVIEK